MNTKVESLCFGYYLGSPRIDVIIFNTPCDIIPSRRYYVQRSQYNTKFNI